MVVSLGLGACALLLLLLLLRAATCCLGFLIQLAYMPLGSSVQE